MTTSALGSALLRAYDAAWLAATPLLALSPRLRQGLRQRLLNEGPLSRPPGFADIWIQAASAGEAHLAAALLPALPPLLPENTKLTVCMTSCTRQGLDILDAAARDAREALPHLTPLTAYFPFDRPSLMDAALDRLQPKAVVLLETELWPGLLASCARMRVPALVINGRMTARSLAGYLAARRVFRAVAPRRVLATTEASATRFGLLFGHDRVERMPNIKFDRFLSQLNGTGPDRADSELATLLGDAPLAVFGSVRREEEPQVLAAVKALLTARPQAVAALFPRHMHRLDAWRELLAGAGLPFAMRSRLGPGLSGPPAPGTVILWDAFGELSPAYALASAAFVGGSLRPLGGQNFLEPLACGVAPVIGPHWSNFDWVGRGIVDAGLVYEEPDAHAVASRMAALLARPRSRAAVIRKTAAYVSEHGGGVGVACEAIAEYL